MDAGQLGQRSQTFSRQAGRGEVISVPSTIVIGEPSPRPDIYCSKPGGLRKKRPPVHLNGWWSFSYCFLRTLYIEKMTADTHHQLSPEPLSSASSAQVQRAPRRVHSQPLRFLNFTSILRTHKHFRRFIFGGKDPIFGMAIRKKENNRLTQFHNKPARQGTGHIAIL